MHKTLFFTRIDQTPVISFYNNNTCKINIEAYIW